MNQLTADSLPGFVWVTMSYYENWAVAAWESSIEAQQLSLSRHVALKVLPFAATLDEDRIRRFRNESLAAASLDHPNIAEVYGVGCERNVHYYAMRLIDGCSWADVIASVKKERSGAMDRAEGSPSDAPTEAGQAATPRNNKTPSSLSQRGTRYFCTVVKLVIDVAERSITHIVKASFIVT